MGVAILADRVDATPYTVEEFESGPEALEHLRNDRAFDVLITDVLMPEMSGHALAERAIEVVPMLRVVLISGFATEQLINERQWPMLRELVSEKS